MKKRRIGILTGGGDCPGINAVIRAAAKTAVHMYGMEAVGLIDGFRGLVDDETVPLTFDRVSNILTQGGTILGTSSRTTYFGVPSSGSPHAERGPDRLKDARRIFRKHRLEGIICIGGDGTLGVAAYLHGQGIPMVGVPKTIDNDVRHTDLTFGFDTATAIAAEAVDRLHSTAASHHRVMVVEVMGRHAGWIALQAGIAGGGDILLIPEIPFHPDAVTGVVRKRSKKGRRFSIVVAAEGAHPSKQACAGSDSLFCTLRPEQHGSIGPRLAEAIQRETGLESRATVLGHLQRGGTPTPFDRVLATRFGYWAARLCAERGFGKMVCLKGGVISSVPLAKAARGPRRIPRDSPLLTAARAVGTSFGI